MANKLSDKEGEMTRSGTGHVGKKVCTGESWKVLVENCRNIFGGKPSEVFPVGEENLKGPRDGLSGGSCGGSLEKDIVETFVRGVADDLQEVPSRESGPGRKKGRMKDSVHDVSFGEDERSTGCAGRKQDSSGGTAKGDVTLRENVVESHLDEMERGRGDDEGRFDLTGRARSAGRS